MGDKTFLLQLVQDPIGITSHMDQKDQESQLATVQYVNDYVSVAADTLVAGLDQSLKGLRIEIMTELDRITSRIDAVEKLGAKSENRNNAKGS